MSAPPAGFRRIELRSTVLVLREDVADALVEAGFSHPGEVGDQAPRAYAGRGAAYGTDVPGVGAVFVRPYLHGGLLGKLTSDRYGGNGRFRDEVEILAAAGRAGVPVPEVFGYVSRSAGLGLRRGWLVTREHPGARDLLGWIADGPAPAERRSVLGAAGRAMRVLHDAAIEHQDLHLKNLLLLPGGGKVLVLDLDAARLGEPLDREQRLAGLFRFDRYAAKQAAAGHPVSRTDRLRVLRAYAGADWPERAERREIAARLARHIARHRSVQAPAQEVRR